MKKRGRPCTDEPKNKRLELRIDDDIRDKLIDMGQETGLSESEIVRRAIRTYYRNMRK